MLLGARSSLFFFLPKISSKFCEYLDPPPQPASAGLNAMLQCKIRFHEFERMSEDDVVKQENRHENTLEFSTDLLCGMETI